MNAPFPQMSTQRAPDITLSGEAVEQLFALLNNAVIFVKAQDGSMRPFVDPQPISLILAGALQAAVKRDGN
jgi:hypothetical protein